MSDNTRSQYKVLNIHGIQVQCTAQDAGRPELNNLRLVIVKERDNVVVNLGRVSRTTWKQRNQDPIPIPSEKLLLVATSENQGDFAYIERSLDIHSDCGRDLMWNLERVEDSVPLLSVSFKVSDGGQHRTEFNDLKEILEALHLNKDSPDDHSTKADVLNLTGHRLEDEFDISQDKMHINMCIDAYEQALALLSSDDDRFLDFLYDVARAYHRRFLQFHNIQDVMKEMGIFQRVFTTYPDDDGRSLRVLSNLGNVLLERFGHTGDFDEFRQSLEDFQPSVGRTQQLSNDRSTKADALNNLGRRFGRKFDITQDKVHIDMCIDAYERALAFLSSDDTRFVDFLHDTGMAYHERFQRFCNIEDLKKGVDILHKVLALCPDGDIGLPFVLSNLGSLLKERFEYMGDLDDLAQSIQHIQHAIDLTPEGDAYLPVFLNNLGNSYSRRFHQTKDLTDIEHSIQLNQRAVNLTPEGHADRPGQLSNLGNSLLARFECAGDIADLEHSIQHHQQALNLAPESHVDLPSMLKSFGTSLKRRFQQTGDLRDIDDSIQFQQRAVDLTLEGRADLFLALADLGNSLRHRFEHTGNLSDIDHSIQVMQRAVELSPKSHVDLPLTLDKLGASFICRFERTGDLTDIDKSIQLRQQAVNLMPKGHAQLFSLLNNLGTSLSCRFEHTGDLTDINQSIQLLQRAVDLAPSGHVDLPSMLSNLGSSFVARFRQIRDLNDVNHSMQLTERAVDLTPDGHADLPFQVNNLGSKFSYRFRRTENLADIDRSIQLKQIAVDKAPEGHVNLPDWLSKLGVSFFHRFQETADLADIDNSIRLHQRAVDLAPKDHPDLPFWLSNLGASFVRRFEQIGDEADIGLSMQLHQQAVDLTPEGHTKLPALVHNSAATLFAAWKRTEGHEYLVQANSAYRTSAMSVSGPPLACLASARYWAMLSSSISTSEVITAYDRVVDLITLVAGMENTPKRRHELLTEISGVSTKAAAAALSENEPCKALEWLEAGRCVVWNQVNQLRTPMEDLQAHHPSLAGQLEMLSSRLEKMAGREDNRHSRTEMPMHAQISLETEAHNCLVLTREREQLLTTIRKIPGFENFLRPKKFAELIRSIPEDGVTVVINADESRCDALVLTSVCVNPILVPLENFSYDRATNLAKALRLSLNSRGLQSRYQGEAQANDRGMTVANKTDVLRDVLRDLWTDLVEPILQCLPAEFQNKDGKCDLPHIWWCPTGPFAFLPIHAAGIYKEGASGAGLRELAISSYIPNLSLFGRPGSQRKTSSSNRGVLLVSQADTPGLPGIPFTDQEVDRTSDELSRREVRVAAYRSKEATIATISSNLQSFSCIHLACHASQNTKDPLESAVHLYDGPLKLSEIMRKNLPHAELAFMSACQTSVGDESLAEEAVHLAAGMLTAGYRSVIATMWSISDIHAPDVAEDFYKCLLNDETADGVVSLDITGSAQALHIAVQALRRKVGDSTEGLLKWIPYVHYGI